MIFLIALIITLTFAQWSLVIATHISNVLLARRYKFYDRSDLWTKKQFLIRLIPIIPFVYSTIAGIIKIWKETPSK